MRTCNYYKGRRFEWQIRKYYKDKGYEVIRASSSKGYFDLVAFNPKEIIFVQAKVGREGDFKFFNFEEPVSVKQELWIKKGRKIEKICS